MTWIKTIPISQGDARLRNAVLEQDALYPPEYALQVPGLPDDDDGGIVAAHSLLPDALKHAFATFGALMAPDLPLNRRQHELIATAVSQTNCTHYCSVSHREFLLRATGDKTLVDAMAAREYQNAPLTNAEKVMVEYAVQITQDATQVTPETHRRLHEAGFDDTAVLQITMIAAWFNYINRVADALGVGRE